MHQICHTIRIHYQDLLAMVKGGGDQEQVDIDTATNYHVAQVVNLVIVGLVAV